jgi:hypothetical protein
LKTPFLDLFLQHRFNNVSARFTAISFDPISIGDQWAGTMQVCFERQGRPS